MADIKIKLTKSLIGSKKDQIATAHSLGLRKIGNVLQVFCGDRSRENFLSVFNGQHYKVTPE